MIVFQFFRQKKFQLLAIALNFLGNWFVYAQSLVATAATFQLGVHYALWGLQVLNLIIVVMLNAGMDSKKDFKKAFYMLVDGIIIGLILNAVIAGAFVEAGIFGFILVVSFLLNEEV